MPCVPAEIPKDIRNTSLKEESTDLIFKLQDI
jgi:hypothetical protein